MERVEAAWASEHEAEEEEEAAGGVLERRRSGKMGNEANGARKLEAVEGGEERSVYFVGEEDKGVWKCRHCIWTYQLGGPRIDHIQKHEGYCQLVMDTDTLIDRGTYFDSSIKGILFTDEMAGMKISKVNHFIDDKNKSQVNGKTDLGTKEFNNLESILVSEEVQNHSSKDEILEDGSSSILPFRGHNENGFPRSELEIEDVHDSLVNKSKLEVADIDLEKVLEEQDTHDLFCPNCNSCITKRVILRKRKRTVQEIQSDAPPAKVQLLHHLDATTASADMTELGPDREPDIFRCLSCFSFFIPTDTGFNIFRIFGRRGQTENLQTSQQLPAKNVNWNPSVFNPVASTTTESESGLTLPSQSDSSSVKQMDETSTNIQTSAATTAFGAISHGENQVTIENKYTETSLSIFRIFGRRGKPENLRTSQQLPSKDVNWNSSIFKQTPSSTGVSESGLPLPSESTVASVQQTIVTSTNMQTSPATTILVDVSLGESQITTGENDAVVGVQLPAESNTISGGDASFEEKKSSLTITILSSSDLEEGQSTIGEKDAESMPWDSFITAGEVGDSAKNSMQDYLAKTESGGLNLGKSRTMAGKSDTGDDMIQPFSLVKSTFPEMTPQISQTILGSVPPATVVSIHGETEIYVREQRTGEAGRRNDWDVLKSIVYGGLIESVTSLSVVSSAAGSYASTLNIVALGLANLIGGLLVIAHDLSDLRSTQEEAADKNGEPVGRYWKLLGRKTNFRLHATIAVLTYIVVGLLSPVIYGFSFRKSDNKEYKLIAVAAASLLCISLLALGKAHVMPRKTYIKTLSYYLSLGIGTSGLSYVAGVMIHRLLDQLGLYDNGAAALAPPADMYYDVTSALQTWASS